MEWLQELIPKCPGTQNWLCANRHIPQCQSCLDPLAVLSLLPLILWLGLKRSFFRMSIMSSSLTVHPSLMFSPNSWIANIPKLFAHLEVGFSIIPQWHALITFPLPSSYVQSKTCQFEELDYASGLITVMGASVGYVWEGKSQRPNIMIFEGGWEKVERVGRQLT